MQSGEMTPIADHAVASLTVQSNFRRSMETPTKNEDVNMKVNVDRTRCSAIGICESISPDYFEVGDDGALALLREDVTPEDLAEVEEAVRSCPAAALRLEQR
jgi:ferredoxin